MRLCSLEFILREAGANVRRNMLMSLACITTVTITLALSGSVILAFRNVEAILHRVAQELVVAVYLKTDTSDTARDAVSARIAAIPHVQGAPVLVSKEHAWKVFSATIPDSLKGEVDGNPLPDAFMVRVDSPIEVPLVADALKVYPEVDKVNAPYLEAQRAASILRIARLATDGITILLVLVTTFLVMNTIRLTLYARRHEIRVMQLVGASNSYIRTPFILEGLMLGAIGGGFACACLALAYPYLLHLAQQAMVFDLPLLQPGQEMTRFYAEIAGVGAGIGAFGSLVSVRRFLRPVERQVVVRRLRPKDMEKMDAERMNNAQSSVATVALSLSGMHPSGSMPLPGSTPDLGADRDDNRIDGRPHDPINNGDQPYGR